MIVLGSPAVRVVMIMPVMPSCWANITLRGKPMPAVRRLSLSTGVFGSIIKALESGGMIVCAESGF